MKLLTDIILPVILILILVAVVAFFASSETAYLSINSVKLHQMLKEDTSGKKNSPAKRVAFLKKNTEQLLSIILIGINFITSFASGLAATVAINLFGNAGSAYATIVMAFILIIFGEITPKTVAAVHPVKVAEKYSIPLILLQKIFFPLVWFFAKITNGITKVMNSFFKNNKAAITEEELKSLITAGEKAGTLEHSEKNMLYKIFDFSDLHVKDIMRHKSLVKFIPENANYKEVVKIFQETGYSRIPVCGLDPNGSEIYSFENVLGVIQYKTILTLNPNANSKRSFAQRCMKNVEFIPETLTATEILVKFKRNHFSFAVAIDENGCNSGIITMDDILRAVFGRSVNDENNEVPPENRIQTISSVEFNVPGDMKLDDLNELLKLELTSDIYDTLGGWLLEQFDALPESGEILVKNDIIYEILDQSQRRIQNVKIKFPETPSTEK